MCPDDTSSTPVGRATTCRPRLADQERAARHFQVSPATIRNWLSRGSITGYRVPNHRMPWVDLDEIESAFVRYRRTKMRDGRRTYGDKARIVAAPLGIVAQPAVES